MKTLPKTILDVDILNKTILLRLNLDVLLKDLIIQDDFKIKNAIETISYLIKQKCKVVILSSLGNPNAKEVDELSLMPIRFALGRILEKQIKFANIKASENSIKFMDFGEVLMLENLEFNPEETSKSTEKRDEFISKLVNLCDYYVFDSYGSNLNVASIYNASKSLKTFIGLQLKSEIEFAKKFSFEGNNGITAILGDEKESTILNILDFITKGANTLLVGGNLGIHFLASLGIKTGETKLNSKLILTLQKYIKLAKKNNCQIVLPVDHIAIDSKGKITEIETQQINKGFSVYDIGFKTIGIYREIIESSKRIIWAGAMGEFTNEKFNKGTESIGEFIALSTSKECFKASIGENTYYAMNLLKIKPKRFNFSSVDSILLKDFMLNQESDILSLLTKK